MLKNLLFSLVFVTFSLCSNTLGLNQNNDGTWDVTYSSEEIIAGFQFNVDNAVVNSATGGDATANDFMISSSSTTVIGFSMTGGYVPKGRYSIMEVEFVLQSSRICLDGLVVSGEMGNALNYEIGECWIH